MNLFVFDTMFPGDKECLEFFIAIRECAGVKCTKCGCVMHTWSLTNGQFECERCGIQIDIKCGTIMENTKLPIRYWFIAMCMLTSSAEELSTSQLNKLV